MSIENVLGFDLETTGLDPKEDGILEIGMQVIAPNFDRLDHFVICIEQPESVLARMSPAVRSQHERSGLLEACAGGSSPENAFHLAAAFVKKWWPEGRAILLGSSIHFDRAFIKSQIPELERLLHYRMIDSSAIREAMRIFGSQHRTTVDIDNSLATVREFVERVK